MIIRVAASVLTLSVGLVCVPQVLRSSAAPGNPTRAGPTQLATYPDGRDLAALTYDSAATATKKQTLHQLATAALEDQRLKALPSMTSTQRWTSKISNADDPAAALQSLQKTASGQEAKQLNEARASIAAVMAQSNRDMALRKQVLQAAQTTQGTGNSWNSLLERQIGPHSLALASDWLSTEEATSTAKNKKSVLARAQLAAALSQVGGHFEGERRAGEEEASHERGRDKEMSFETAALGHVMSNALGGSGSYGGGASGVMGNNGRGAFEAGGGGFSSEGSQEQNGAASMSGAAPGLSSYDAQILANGPPS